MYVNHGGADKNTLLFYPHIPENVGSRRYKSGNIPKE
jgi:hypothetical protein